VLGIESVGVDVHYVFEQQLQNAQGCLGIHPRLDQLTQWFKFVFVSGQNDLPKVAFLLRGHAIEGGRVGFVHVQLDFRHFDLLAVNVGLNETLVVFSFVGHVAVEGLSALLVFDHVFRHTLVHVS